jgi:integrase/recombinase XerD
MNLSNGIEVYVQRKRTDGRQFNKGASNLLEFYRHVGDKPPLNNITTQHVQAYLDGPRTSTPTWRAKHSLLRHFFEFWNARGAMPLLLLPQQRPPDPPTFIPYIYTKAEIHALLISVRTSQGDDNCAFDAQTFRTFLLTLYATGALVGEVLNLLCEDVDLQASAIKIRSNRFGRSRRIPISHDLRDILRSFLNSRRRKSGKRFRLKDHLFMTKAGAPLRARNLGIRFEKLRAEAGIIRHDGAVYQPRMHDLRITFAVHRITSWIRKGADLNRMLPALAAYMGQVGLASTERYLSLTPERFRKELDKLSPGRGTKHWRDDRDLMKFLDEL